MMRSAMWTAVVLLAVIAGLQAYGVVSRPTASVPAPQPPAQEAQERVTLSGLRLDRSMGRLRVDDAEFLRLLEMREAERRLDAISMRR